MIIRGWRGSRYVSTSCLPVTRCHGWCHGTKVTSHFDSQLLLYVIHSYCACVSVCVQWWWLLLMPAWRKHRALGFYIFVRICRVFSASKCRERSDPGLCTILVLAKRMPSRIGDFRRIWRPNTIFNRKSPPRCGFLFASTEVVNRLRSDLHLHVDLENIYQICLETNSCRHAQALLACLPRQDHVWITIDELNRRHNT